MKRIFTIIAIALLVGCATTERSAYVVTGSLTTAVELSRQAYNEYANTCQCVHESEYTKVEAMKVKYEQAALLATKAITAYKTSTVPNRSALTMAIDVASSTATDFITLIQSLLPASDTAKLKTKLPQDAKLPKGVTQP